MSIKKILVSALLVSAVMTSHALAQNAAAPAAQPSAAKPAPAPAPKPAPAPAPAAAPAQAPAVAPAPAPAATPASAPAAAPAPAPATAPATAAAPAPVSEVAAAAPAPQAAEPVAAQTAIDDDEPAAPKNVPALSYWGVRGLSQTVSAEPLGMGRLSFSLFSSYFRQTDNLTSPKVGTNVVLGRAGVSWGINDYTDVFGILPLNGTSYYDSDDGATFDIGGIAGGAQISLPMPKSVPFLLAAQLHLIYGLSDEDHITKHPSLKVAGYDYYDTKTKGNFDVVGKFIQTVLLSIGDIPLKLHGNEGIGLTTGSGSDWLLLLAAGIQVDPLDILTIGLEFNSRTTLERPTISDPLWLTPSVMYRSPFNFGVLVGCDVALSNKSKITVGTKTSEVSPLAPYRVFGDIVLSFDVLASKREAEAQKRREEAAEKARLERETQLLAAQKAEIAKKAQEDSIRAAEEMIRRAEADSLRAKAIADSLANIIGTVEQKAREDSLAMAASAAQQKAAADAALAEAQKKLEEEKAKRSEAEQFLLTSGMLVLDAVYFTSGKAEISRNSLPYLRTIAQMLAKYPKLKIEIGGHTDNVGRHETNVKLSQQRAEAVYLFMINTDSALAQMLAAKGYGPTVPKEDNKTAAGREANRRVELKVLNPDVLKEYNP